MLFEEFQDGILDIGTEAYHQVLAQYDLRFGRRCHLKNFKMPDGHHGSHLGHWNGTILAILNLCLATMPPTMFQLNPTYGS